MTRAGWALACVLLAGACQEAPQALEEIRATPTGQAEALPSREDPAEVEAAPEPEPTELDDMDRAALEAACFEGSQAACDRLGH